MRVSRHGWPNPADNLQNNLMNAAMNLKTALACTAKSAVSIAGFRGGKSGRWFQPRVQHQNNQLNPVHPTKNQTPMKTPNQFLRISFRSINLLLLLFNITASLNALGQAPPGLSIQTYAGLSITGGGGTVYQIQYVVDLAQTNNPSAWRCLEFLQLPASPYLWADKSAPATGRRFYRAQVFSAPTNMVFIPPGTFRMGSPSNELDRSDNEGPQTAVTISHGSWMGKYEVTQGEFLAVMGFNPSASAPYQGAGDPNPTHPVYHTKWFDAVNYCTSLTQRERAAGRIATNSVYRLPTEAEWEYACRAGASDRRLSYGDDPGYTNISKYAWVWPSDGSLPHRGGQLLPNLWGLYDMYGNLWEWCQDSWGDHLPGGITIDPQGPIPTNSLAVLRGGDFGGCCPRSAIRLLIDPNNDNGSSGFRVLLVPGQ